MRTRLLFTCSLLAALSACEYYKLEEIKHAEPAGTPYQKALWSNYRDLSKTEERNYDWEHAVMYADKALRAAYGEDVPAENPMDWDVPADLMQQFKKAYEDLLAMQQGDAKTVRPQLVADAQTNFDCWLEQQEEAWKLDEIAFCRDNFYDAMQELFTPVAGMKTPVKAAKKASAPKPVAKAEPVPVAAPTETAPEPKKEAAYPTLAPATEAPVTAPTPEPVPAVAPEAPVVEPTPTPAPVAAPLTESAPVAAPAAKEVETASYIVFFDAGQEALTPTGEKIVDDAAQTLRSVGSYNVIINARTDAVGTETDLPVKRAQMIKNRLILQGVTEGSIDLVSSSEAQAGAPKAVERRVEIFISE